MNKTGFPKAKKKPKKLSIPIRIMPPVYADFFRKKALKVKIRKLIAVICPVFRMKKADNTFTNNSIATIYGPKATFFSCDSGIS